MKTTKKDILFNQTSDIKNEKEKNGQNHIFLKIKRKSPFESEKEEEFKEEVKSDDDGKFCQNCHVKINFKTGEDADFEGKKMFDDLNKIIFENKNEANNIFLNALNEAFNEDIENKKKFIFFKNLQKYCNLCLKKIFIKGGFTNFDLI